jgi:hypothetical protein
MPMPVPVPAIHMRVHVNVWLLSVGVLCCARYLNVYRSKFLMAKLRSNTVNAVAPSVCSAVDSYLQVYGHQGYSMDFVEPTQVEDPSALFGTLYYTILHPT